MGNAKVSVYFTCLEKIVQSGRCADSYAYAIFLSGCRDFRMLVFIVPCCSDISHSILKLDVLSEKLCDGRVSSLVLS